MSDDLPLCGYWQPRHDRHLWEPTRLIPFSPSGSQGLPLNAFSGVSCPSTDLCAAVGSRGLIFTNRDPFDVEETRGEKRRGAPNAFA